MSSRDLGGRELGGRAAARWAEAEGGRGVGEEIDLGRVTPWGCQDGDLRDRIGQKRAQLEVTRGAVVVAGEIRFRVVVTETRETEPQGDEE